MKLQAGETIQAIISAASVRVPVRPIGILSVMYETCSSGIASTIAVRMTAGASAFTVTPVVAYSLPCALTMPISPALEAEYATMPALPSLPAMEATCRMRPYPRCGHLPAARPGTAGTRRAG